MMQLVMQYGIGDGCTFWCTNTHPFIYESAEQALVDFEIALKIAIDDKINCGEFSFAGITMAVYVFVDDGIITLPNIWTVDEWFTHECENL